MHNEFYILCHGCLQLVDTLRQFLQQHVDVLDPGTIIGILSGYGRVEELLFFAKCIGDNELLLEYLVQRGEVILMSIRINRSPTSIRMLQMLYITLTLNYVCSFTRAIGVTIYCA